MRADHQTPPSLLHAAGAGRVPPAELYRGELGPELLVLTHSEIRIAECAAAQGVLETADGTVGVRPGDFIVSMSNGERFPILAPIYFGTYEVLSRVGPWFVGRRLLHPRRAWPIVSAGAEFCYGPERGWVSATRGGWVYQSDEQDFGVINAAVNLTSHEVVGNARDLDGDVDWQRRFSRWSTVVALLPPFLTALAAAALGLQLKHPVAATALLGVEALLLALGVWGVWYMHWRKWSLKAAIMSGQAVARRFQDVARAAGEAPSELFPTMSLWRAAQADGPPAVAPSATDLRAIKDLIDESHEEVLHELEHHHRLERIAQRLSWLAAIGVLACLAAVVMTHEPLYKLVAIWLPSAVGAAHAWTWRRQSAHRVSAGSEMLRELRFVKARLMALAPDDEVGGSEPVRRAEILAVLRMLCLTVARKSQRDLRFTAAETAGIPV